MTREDAADWMLSQFEAKRFLYQEEAASHLLHLRDERLAYFDKSGNVCIDKLVLKQFNKLTPDLVYERADKFVKAYNERVRPTRVQVLERAQAQGTNVDESDMSEYHPLLAYEHFFFHYSATPLLVVETSQLDLATSDAAVDDLMRQIRTMSRGTRYYVPRPNL